MAVSYSIVSHISSQNQAIWNDFETIGAKILTILTVILILTREIKRQKIDHNPRVGLGGGKKAGNDGWDSKVDFMLVLLIIAVCNGSFWTQPNETGTYSAHMRIYTLEMNRD